VLCIGVPFQYTESRILKARLEFLRETYRIRENDFLSFDAMRHAAQCLGRVLRGKDDYGIMVLADRRFGKKRVQLPKWINAALLEGDSNLSVDQAVATAKRFLKMMSKPFPARMQEGVSTWSLKDLEAHKAKVEKERMRDERNAGVVEGVSGDAVMREAHLTAEEDEFGGLDDEDIMQIDA
jgi:DNA excision repair protein ERCC-2